MRRKERAAKRLFGGVAVACAAAAAAAPAAGAATVGHDPDAASGSVTYAGALSEVNDLQVVGDGQFVQFSDSAAIDLAPAGVGGANDCTVPVDSLTASCPFGPVQIALGNGDDTITAGPGAPGLTIDGGAGDDTLVDLARSDGTTFTGDDGVDRADYSARTEPVSVSLNATADDGAAGEADNISSDAVVGGAAADTITGDDAANRLSGGAGADELEGESGDDVVDGGAGDDKLRGGAGTDSLIGSEGADELRGDDGDDVLTGGDGNDALDGGAGVDDVSGGAGDDTVTAADGVAETIDCGPGDDTVTADVGANDVMDTLVGCEHVSGPPASAPPTQPAPPVPAGTPAGPDTSASGSDGYVPSSAVDTVVAPGVPDATDLTPPDASLRARGRQRLRPVLKRGLPVRVSCTESCGISAALTMQPAKSRRLGAGPLSAQTVVGTATAQRTAAGTSVLRVRVASKARRTLRKRRRVRLTLQVVVSDASGNGRLLQRRLTLVR